EPARVGITAYAAKELGDVVFAELTEVGAAVTAGEVCGELESTKSVAELFSPVSGTVAQRNDAVVAHPEHINTDPYAAGWLFSVHVTETGPLLDAQQYAEHVEGTVE